MGGGEPAQVQPCRLAKAQRQPGPILAAAQQIELAIETIHPGSDALPAPGSMQGASWLLGRAVTERLLEDGHRPEWQATLRALWPSL